MKRSHLIVLGALVAVLVAVRLIMGLGSGGTARDLSEAGVAGVGPGDLEAAAVEWIEVSPPQREQGAAPLRIERRGEEWVVASAQDAPAEAEPIGSFLEQVLDLSGEVRGEGTSVFADFGVDEEQAHRVRLGQGDDAALTLFLGKGGDGPDTLFVRADGEDVVRHVRAGLRRDLGLFGEDGVVPTDHWVERVVLEIPGEQVTRMAVRRPDVSYELVKEAAPPTEGDDSGDAAAAPAAVWRVASPSLAWTPKGESGLAGLVSRAARVRIDGVLDPAEVPACDVSDDSATLELEDEAGQVHRVTVGAVVPGGDDRVLRLEGRPHCFSIAKWSVSSLLPKAAAIWDAPQAFADAPLATEMAELELVQGGQEAQLTADEEGEWSFQSPEEGAAAKSVVNTLLNSLRTLRVDDLGEVARLPPEALEVYSTVVVRAKEGERLGVELLGRRFGPGGEERYARITQPAGASWVPDGFVAVLTEYATQKLTTGVDQLRDPAG